MREFAPIVLFVYNRPWHTLQTLEALSANLFASSSLLYIFSDGYKNIHDINEISNVNEVRSVIRKNYSFNKVIIKESGENLGLADSIMNGVTEVIEKHGKVIVLEDDIVTSPGFLKYMNDALDIYAREEKVMHVSGYMFPLKATLSNTFFYNTATCWGWGTWARAWEKFERDPSVLLNSIDKLDGKYHFNVEGSYPYYEHLVANKNKSMKTWAVRWYANLYLNNGYSLHPFPSLTQNIGDDSTGSNSENLGRFKWEKLADSIEVNKIEIKEDIKVRKLMCLFNRGIITSSPGLYNIKMNIKSVIPAGILNKIKRRLDPERRKRLKELKRLGKIQRYYPAESNVLGNKITIPDSASFLFTYYEIFEKQIYKFQTSVRKPYIIDCGANIGLSVIYFKSLFPECEITAFEPDKGIYATLVSNLQSFGFSNVMTIQKALWSKEGHLDFISEGADSGRISNNQKEANATVETVRLKDYLDRKVDFLKIDIEGAETEVLSDCRDLLKNVERIFIEYHSFSGVDQSLDVILKILKESGFRFYINTPGIKSDNPFMKINTYSGMDMQLNIYGVRNV
ncbi:MAG: FkbM family methyltransferase [Cytophagaceae bacterium]